MFGRLVIVAIIAAAAYWYWSGPYRERTHPDLEQKLRKNAEDMRLCIRSGNYQAGATGSVSGNIEQACADRFNLYKHDGQWYSYDEVRK